MTTAIPIDLATLRNLIFDIGGLDREFVTIEYLNSKGIDAAKLFEIMLSPTSSDYFHVNKKDVTLWQPRAWKASAERHYKERERNARDVSRHELRKEALSKFATGLYNTGYIRTSRDERIAIGEMLLRKKNYIKFAALSGLDLTDEKWKGLME